jgi:sugar phosphate isomerase/epimerase
MTRDSRLCVHTITTKPWPIEVAMDRYAAAGIGGITVWRQALEGRNIARVGDDLRARNLEIVSLCRGGFFPNKTAEGRAEAIEENRRAIREAAELGAPLVVLVCGAVPGQPLAESRRLR